MKYAGLDVHKRVVEATVLDESGAVVHRERFDCTRAELQRFAVQHLGADCKVALEATTNTWGVYDVLSPHVGEVVVSNPLRTRAIAEAKVKTDKVDAMVLAQLLRTDFLPRVWRPDEQTQRVRRLCSRRAGLVSDRTRIKNRIHAVFHQRLIAVPHDKLFGNKGMAWLKSAPLDELGRAAVDSELRLLEAIERELNDLSIELARVGYQDPRIKLLITLPGVDVTVAQALVSTLGDVARFPDPDRAAAYLGIVPSVKQSAEHCYHGPITKHGKSHTRWLLVQAAQHVASHPGPLGVFFRRLLKKKNRNVAVVATARKLVTIAWHMLKNNEPYRYAQPLPTERKLQALRTKGGGQRRKPGTQKGKPRPPNYGTGTSTRRLPGLQALYDAEGLPQTKPLKPAEKRMLKETRTARFADKIQREQRIPRKSANSKAS